MVDVGVHTAGLWGIKAVASDFSSQILPLTAASYHCETRDKEELGLSMDSSLGQSQLLIPVLSLLQWNLAKTISLL